MANVLFSFILTIALFKFEGSTYEKVSQKSLLVIDILRAFSPDQAYKVVEFSCETPESVTLLRDVAKNGHYGSTVKISADHIPLYSPANLVVFVLEMSCNSSQELLRNASKQQIFSAPYHWVLIRDSLLLENYFSDLDVLLDSDVTICESLNYGSFDLTKVYKRKENTTPIFEPFANWSSHEGLVVHHNFESNVAVRRQNLNGTVLVASLVITDNNSLAHLTDRRDKHIDTIAKVNYVLIQHMGKFLNAEMRYSVESSWGYQDEHFEWNGMIGELTSGKADIGGTPMFFTKIRLPVVDYIAMTNPTRVSFVFRKPKLSYITNVYTLPFNTAVWISLLALVVTMTIGMYVVIKWEWYKKRIYGIDDDDKNAADNELLLQTSVYDVCFLAHGAVCQQGVTIIPFTIAGRTVTIFLLISLMFLYTSYSANIVAMLQSDYNSIQTLNDLLQSPLQVGVDDTVYNRFYFPEATEPTRRALYLRKVAPPGQKPTYMPLKEGVSRMREGLFAFHMESGPGYRIVEETFKEHEKCGFQEIPFLQFTDTWTVIRKNFSYKEVMKMGFRKIHESGLQNRELSLLYTKKPQCISHSSSYISVGIIDCYFAGAVFAGGAGCAIIIFLLEVLCYKFNTVIN